MLKSSYKFPFLDLHVWVLAIRCCEERCLRQLSINDVRYAEARKQTGKQNYFLEVLHKQSHRNKSGEYETEFYVQGKAVCREAWLQAHNLSKDSFWRITNKFKEGATMVEHGNKGKNYVMNKTAESVLLGHSSL